MNLKIKENFNQLLFPLTDDEYSLLEQSIIKEGCRDSIIIWNNTIVDGHNRYSICQKHNIKFNVNKIEFKDEEEAKEWIDKNQMGKRNLTDDQRRIIRGRIYNSIKQQGQRTDLTCGQIVQKSSEKVAKEFGVSEKTIRRDGKFAEEVDKNKELQKAINEKKSIKQVKKEKKIEKRKTEVEDNKKKIEKENLIITDKFDVVVIDPPWDYAEHGGFTVNEHDPDSNRGGVDYSTMSVEKISDEKLPLKDNAVVFLWTTQAFLHDAFHLLEKWGLEYKATIVWDKEKMGLGRTIRLQCEFCLMAVKGKPIIQGLSERDIIREARREHSRKPNKFYEMVERMTVGNKIDYFSREQRKGWISYGAETNKF